MPTRIDGARFAIDLRLGATAPGGRLQGLAIDIGAFVPGSFQSLAPIAALTPADAPSQWTRIERPLTAAEARAITARIRSGGQVVLLIRLFGDNIAADIDNASLKVDGATALPALPGSIAVIGKDDKGLRLDRLSPDGRGQVMLWRGENAVSQSYGLCWRPDGEALCFTSSHEAGSSLFTADLYELSAAGLRRISNAPSLASLKEDPRPTGKVKVKLRNLTERGVVANVYVQGGRKLAAVSLAPRSRGADSAEVIVDDVIDLGLGVGQYVAVTTPRGNIQAANTVDVEPGKTATLAGELAVTDALPRYTAASPSYRPDGQRIAFSLGLLTAISPRGLIDNQAFGSLKGLAPAWGPDGRLAYLNPRFDLMSYAPGDKEAKTLIRAQGGALIDDVSWLDKDRLVFTRPGSVPGFNGLGTNLYLHDLRSKQSRALTEMLGEHWASPSPSPDSQWIAAIRRWSLGKTEHRELWVMKLGAPALAWRLPVSGQPLHCAWEPKPGEKK